MARRRTDRVLILLFFVDFMISIVLAVFVARAVQAENMNLELTCLNREHIVQAEEPMCDEVLGR